MRRMILSSGLLLVASLSLVSCAKEPEKKPVPPKSDNSRLSWTGQVTNPLQGQFGMLPQNQHRR